MDGLLSICLLLLVSGGTQGRQTLLAADNVQLSSLFNLGVAR